MESCLLDEGCVAFPRCELSKQVTALKKGGDYLTIILPPPWPLQLIQQIRIKGEKIKIIYYFEKQNRRIWKKFKLMLFVKDEV